MCGCGGCYTNAGKSLHFNTKPHIEHTNNCVFVAYLKPKPQACLDLIQEAWAWYLPGIPWVPGHTPVPQGTPALPGLPWGTGVPPGGTWDTR